MNDYVVIILKCDIIIILCLQIDSASFVEYCKMRIEENLYKSYVYHAGEIHKTRKILPDQQPFKCHLCLNKLTKWITFNEVSCLNTLYVRVLTKDNTAIPDVRYGNSRYEISI